MKRLGVIAILLLAFAGLADSFYLAQHKSNGIPLLCNIENLTGCNVVASSKYSYLLGIPVANLGIVYYSLVFIFAALELILFDRLLRRLLQLFAVIGLAVSLYSTGVQIFFIKALCIYCLISAAITVLIFSLASFLEPLRRRAAAEAVASVPTTESEMNPLPMPPV